MKVQRKCVYCGDPFMARSADVKRGWAKFCSKSCKASEQEKRTHQHTNFLYHQTGREDDEEDYLGHPFESGYFGHGQE
jgi:hypothetical protein